LAQAEFSLWLPRTMTATTRMLNTFVISNILTVLLAEVVGSPQGLNHSALDQLPILSLKLVPAVKSLTEVNAEARKLEHQREKSELALAQMLQRAFETELADAKVEINGLVAKMARTHRFASFLQTQQHGVAPGSLAGFTVKVSLVEPGRPDPSALAVMAKLERKRSALEESLFNQAREEMKALTAVVLKTLEANLAAPHRLGFLETRVSSGLSPEANVRIGSSESAFPRVADVVREMEFKRDRAETQVRKTILGKELELLKAETEMVREALAQKI
jgi:hypothetical protein